MKQIRKFVRYTLIAMMLVSTSYAFGQDQTSTDYPFIYHFDAETLNESPKINSIYPIQLFPIQDEITICKKDSVVNEALQSLVKSYIPDAQFTWPNANIPNYCSVSSGSAISDDVIAGLREKDDVSFVCRKYTRKIYKDLSDIYPVTEIATYGFRGGISIIYLSEETMEEANSLIASKGLSLNTQYLNRGYVIVPKDMDIFAVSNELYESGLFVMATPTKLIDRKTLSAEPVDKSDLPSHYDYSGIKQYWYELSDRFTVRRSSSISKSALESVIKGQLTVSDITWDNDSICTVVTYPDQIAAAMETLSAKDEVLRVSHKYFDVNGYELVLKEGLKTPMSFGLTGVIEISFKNDISEADKNKIINDYNLKFVGGIAEFNSWKYDVPKTLDVLTVSKSIFETGLVVYSKPVTTAVYKVIFWGPSSNVEKIVESTKEIGTQYYNLSGQRIDTPTGLTIVVTRYSDGTVRTEKRLY